MGLCASPNDAIEGKQLSALNLLINLRPCGQLVKRLVCLPVLVNQDQSPNAHDLTLCISVIIYEQSLCQGKLYNVKKERKRRMCPTPLKGDRIHSSLIHPAGDL